MNSPAYHAGLGPGMRIVAVNGRRATDDLLRQAIDDSKGRGPAVQLIVENAGYFRTVTLADHEGERYPHLVRSSGQPFLDDILKPLAAHPQTAAASAE